MGAGPSERDLNGTISQCTGHSIELLSTGNENNKVGE